MEKKVRILYTIPNFTTAGSGQAMVNVIDRLDRNRFEPTVVVATPGGRLVDHLESRRVPVLVAPVTTDLQPLSTLPARIWRAREPFRGRFDLWHSFNWQGDFTEPLIAYASGARAWVYTKKNMGFATKSWRIRSLLARRIAVQNDEMTRRFFSAPWYRHKVRYIPTGIDVEPWQEARADEQLRDRLGIPGDAVVITCVGDVQPRKNQAVLVPALAHLPHTHLLLAGRSLDAGYTEAIETHAAALGVADRLHLLGAVDDVPGLLKVSDVFVLLSHAEGSPIAMLEAMAVGLPGIYSAIPGIEERVADGRDCFVVDPDDEDAVLDRVRRLVDDAALRESMGRAARASAELRGRVEIEAARYETLYLEMFR